MAGDKPKLRIGLALFGFFALFIGILAFLFGVAIGAFSPSFQGESHLFDGIVPMSAGAVLLLAGGWLLFGSFAARLRPRTSSDKIVDYCSLAAIAIVMAYGVFWAATKGTPAR